MPRPRIDLSRKIKDIVKHVQSLPEEAAAPILHYQRTISDIWASLAYIERAIGQGERYESVVERHLGRLYGMALVNLVETFERFLKEVAAECVDRLADFIADDRFNVFNIQGSSLAAHFVTDGTLGKNPSANPQLGSTAEKSISGSESYYPTRFKTAGSRSISSPNKRSSPRPSEGGSRR